jgi:hypothetical protein
MTEWTQGVRPRRPGLAWLAAGAAAVALALGSAGRAAAQTTGTTTRTTTTGGTTGTSTTAASSPPAVSQSAQFEDFLFEVMIDLVFEDFMAMGGGTPDQFMTFLEGTLGGLIGPELSAAANGTGAALPDPGDDEFLTFEEFLMELFVAQAQADFNARGGGTAAQFQAFLGNALATAGSPQLAGVARNVAAADAASGTTSTSTTGSTTSTTSTGTSTGTRTTTTGTTGTTTGTTGTRTGTTGTTGG